MAEGQHHKEQDNFEEVVDHNLVLVLVGTSFVVAAVDVEVMAAVG